VIRRALAAILFVAGASPVAAQGPVTFFPRYDFYLAAEHLSQKDPRFVWDTNFGGAMDLLDYGFGRATFAANYEAVLGQQFRNFDPNQGNYLLDGSVSLRGHGFEAAALFHHTSRHLSDRFKRTPVAWNMLGMRVEHDLRLGRAVIRPRVEMLDVLGRSNVDYLWEADGGVDVRVPVRSRLSMISGGTVRFFAVDDSHNRDDQTGGRIEGGVRLEGDRGAIEVVIAGERRIDAYPLDASSLSWWSAGFRFVSR
jgi:hypothetical protein